MLDISWGEMLVIGGVALVVIGPQDLPKALRTLGSMTAKLRRMAGEFRSQFDEAMREAEMADIRKDLGDLDRTVSGAKSFDPIGTIRDEIKGAVEAKAPAAPPAPAAPVPEPVIAIEHPPVPDLAPELLAPPAPPAAAAPAPPEPGPRP